MNDETILLNNSKSTTVISSDSSYPRLWLISLARTYTASVLFITIIVGVVILPTMYQIFLAAATTSQSLYILNQVGMSEQWYAILIIVCYMITFVISTAMGLMLFLKRSSENVITLLASTLFAPFSVAIILIDLPNLDPIWRVTAIIITVFVGIAFYTIIHLFPNGRFVPQWTRWLLLVSIILLIATYTLFVTQAFISYEFLPIFLQFILLLLLLASLGCQIYRYSYVSSQLERQQAKWFFLGLSAYIIGIVSQTIVEILLIHSFDGFTRTFFHYFDDIFFQFIPFIFFVATFVFAVRRYRLWDVDLIINRSLVVAGVSVLLAIVFFPTIFILQTLFQLLLGNVHSPTLPAIAATAVMVALFGPTRQRIQRLVDRHIYGIKADVRRNQRAIPSKVPTMRTPSIGSKTYGIYETAELLGRGAMGEVYKSYHPTLHYEVAIKVLPLNLANDVQAKLRFEREARTVAALQHINIVRVFDFGETTDTCYMVMEYISGQDAAAYLRQRQKLTVDEAMPILREIGDALDYAHEQGVVHRDVKPSNVMLTVSNSEIVRRRAVLTDFGIARILSESSGLTNSGVAVGTLDYMAPEQIKDPKAVDGRVDIYALGVMAYQMFTGKLPFTGENPGVIIFAHLQRPAPDARELEPSLPAQIAVAIQRALEKEPSSRFQTAAAFVDSIATAQLLV